MISAPRDVVFTDVQLDDERFDLLSDWISRPTSATKNGDVGGFQQRRIDWAERLNARDKTIRLTTHSSHERKTLDDIAWIARTIINRRGGGYQARVAKIFDGMHPSFTGPEPKPRKIRSK
jgi:hypothetical protein